MKTLLIKSAIYVCEECGAGKPDKLRLPCSLLLAGAYLKKKGFDVTVQNTFTPEKAGFDGFDVVVAWVPLLEGFNHEIRYLERAKKQNKITVMLLNDPFEGLETEAMETYGFIDYTIRLYERELALERLLSKLRDSIPLSVSEDKGIIFRRQGRVIDCGKMPPAENLYHLASCEEELNALELDRYDEGQVETGRGCAHGCAFCFYNRTRPRKRKPDDIVREMELLSRHLKFTWLHDLDIGADRKWLRELTSLIIEKKINIPWASDMRLEHYGDKKLLEKLRESGCVYLAIGLESANETVRARINKKSDMGKLRAAIDNCVAAGIAPSINLMLGFPWDSDETLEEMRRFVDSTPYIDNIQYARPLRGTPLYEEMKNLKLLDRELTLQDYVTSRSAPLCPTLFLSKPELEAWFKKILVSLSMSRSLKELKTRGFSGFVSRFIKDQDKKKFRLRYMKVLWRMLIFLFTYARNSRRSKPEDR